MANEGPANLHPTEESGQYIHGPMSSGNSLVDMLVGLISGGIAPRPSQTQTYLDASILRERSREFMRLHQQMLLQHQLSQSLGMGNQERPIMGMGAQMLDMATGGRLGDALGYLVGGNPVKAAQRLYAQMTGLTMAGLGGAGNLRNITYQETRGMMEDYTKWIQGSSGKEFIDYTRSYGMQTQDITQAFAQAAEMRLIRGRGGSARDTFQQFLGGGQGNLGYLNALGVTFGTGSPQESMQLLNQMVGAGNIDLGNQAQTTQLENMVWKVKGMSKAAGVSIQAMASIIQEGQQLMRDTPALRYANTTIGMDFATKALGGTAAAVAKMDPNLVRMLGGTEAIARQNMVGEVQAFANPISSRISALYYSLGADKPENKAIREALTTYMRTGKKSDIGFSQFLGELAGITKNSTPGSLYNMALSEEYAARGLNTITSTDTEFRNLMSKTGRSGDIQYIEQMVRYTGVDYDRFKELMEESSGDWVGALNKAANEKGPGAQTRVKAFIDAFHPAILKTGLTDPFMRSLGGSWAKRADDADKASQAIADDTKETERRFGHLRGPFLQNVFTSLMRGDLESKGYTGVIKHLFNPGGNDEAGNKRAQAIIDIAKSGATAADIAALGLEGLDENTANLLAKTGMSARQIMDIKKNDADAKGNKLYTKDIENAQAALKKIGYGKDELLTKALDLQGELSLKNVGKAGSMVTIGNQIKATAENTLKYKTLRDNAMAELYSDPLRYGYLFGKSPEEILDMQKKGEIREIFDEKSAMGKLAKEREEITARVEAPMSSKMGEAVVLGKIAETLQTLMTAIGGERGLTKVIDHLATSLDEAQNKS